MKIELRNASFSYGDYKVFENLNLIINEGETVAIIGHNGSGKSTLSKVIIGLLELKSGQLLFDDVEITSKNIDQYRKKLSIIFQNPDNQFVGSTVRDDIAFGLENRRIPRKEMLELIDKYSKMVKMNQYLENNPEQLSGGQKQRVAIAGALALESDVIIFDESTSMLDPEGTKEINDTIKNLSKISGKTIISITHNIEEAVFADRIIVLKQGSIVLDGKPEEVLSKKVELESSGLEIIDSISIINDLQAIDKEKYKKVEDALWELTFKM